MLVVDDEALIRWSVAQTLGDLGMEIVQADTGRATLEAIASAEFPFDVVVVDLRLPDVADLSLLVELRRTHAATALIVMTAFGTADVVAQARAIGVAAVMAKPFDVHDLARVVMTSAGVGPA